MLELLKSFESLQNFPLAGSFSYLTCQGTHLPIGWSAFWSEAMYSDFSHCEQRVNLKTDSFWTPWGKGCFQEVGLHRQITSNGGGYLLLVLIRHELLLNGKVDKMVTYSVLLINVIIFPRWTQAWADWSLKTFKIAARSGTKQKGPSGNNFPGICAGYCLQAHDQGLLQGL